MQAATRKSFEYVAERVPLSFVPNSYAAASTQMSIFAKCRWQNALQFLWKARFWPTIPPVPRGFGCVYICFELVPIIVKSRPFPWSLLLCPFPPVMLNTDSVFRPRLRYHQIFGKGLFQNIRENSQCRGEVLWTKRTLKWEEKLTGPMHPSGTVGFDSLCKGQKVFLYRRVSGSHKWKWTTTWC